MLRPYKNWRENELKEALVLHINRLDISPEFKHHWRNLVIDAFSDPNWNVLKDYNGCTAVQDYLHPCPACFVHDYTWICGYGGSISDRIFFHLMIAEGMPRKMALRRWVAVRLAWFGYFMWVYVFTRSLKKPTENMKKMNNFVLSLSHSVKKLKM